MKLKTASIISALLLSGGLMAQYTTAPGQQSNDQKNRTSSSTSQVQPPQSGANTDQQFNPPGQSTRSQTPPGRAFDTNNPPSGRPFQGGVNPPGRPFNSGAPGSATSQTGDSTSQNSLNSAPNSGTLGAPAQPQPGTPAAGQPSQPTVGAPAPGTSSAQSSAVGAQGRPGAEQTGAVNVQVNQQQVARMQNVLSNIKPGAGDQKQQLTQTIMSLSPGTRVSQEVVTRFVNDVTTVLPRVTLAPVAQQRLATAIAFVLTPNVEAIQLEPVLTTRTCVD